MSLIIEIIIGLLILVFLVVAHELGHAIAARRSGVVVEEFGVGFPPLIWKKKLKNGVLLKLNWLPIGGYVKMQGEHDCASKKGDYGAATFWQKTKILFAGVFANWLVAAVLLTILAWTGMPRILENQVTIPGDTTVVYAPVEITALTKGYPAENAGLKIGDLILKFNNQNISTPADLINLAKQNKGKNVNITYQRGEVKNDVNITLKAVSDNGYLGANLGQREQIKATWSAPLLGIATTGQLTYETFNGLGTLISNLFSQKFTEVGQSVAGPIGIVGTVFPAAEKAGLTQLTLLTAIISLSLAVMNVLPIPALDGGRWFTMTVFRLSKKKLTQAREEKIQLVGFAILMCLVVLVTYADIRKLF